MFKSFTFNINNPLDQFEVYGLFDFLSPRHLIPLEVVQFFKQLLGVDLYYFIVCSNLLLKVSNMTLFLAIIFLILVKGVYKVRLTDTLYININSVNGATSYLYEFQRYWLQLFYKGIHINIKDNIKVKKNIFFPFLIFLFLFLLVSNLLGMIPYSFTITSHLCITFSLSLLSFLGLNYIGIKAHGIHFMDLFFPAGAPAVIAPLLVLIETASYFARLFSLAIRLFANMMSGHTLLKILTTVCWVLLSSGSTLALLTPFVLVIIAVITAFEIAIACLQAYVFFILMNIYLNEAINLH